MATKTTENGGGLSPHTVGDSTQGANMQGNLEHSFLDSWSFQEIDFLLHYTYLPSTAQNMS